MFKMILDITIIILLIATLIVYFLGVRFTRPILEITQAANTISQGDLNIHLNIKTNDEIEDLAFHFNEMARDLRERKKMQKFVSSSTMDMIQNHEPDEIILGGEHRILTLLFADIRGFTALSEEKTPSETIEIVNFYLNLQAEVLQKHGGYIDKFIGDEVMASFKGRNSVKNAIQSAIEIQSRIAQENKKRLKKNQTVCEVGIGINKGPVIVGNVGSNEHMDFTAMGFAVNIASRLCSQARGGDIIISKKSCTGKEFDYKISKKEVYMVKGVNDPIETYTIVSKHAR